MTKTTLKDTVVSVKNLAVLGVKFGAIGVGYTAGAVIKANDTVNEHITINPEGLVADVNRKSIKRNYSESVVNSYKYLSSSSTSSRRKEEEESIL